MSTIFGASPETTATVAPIGTAVTPTAAKTLDYFPIGMFGSVMSLTILSVAWRLAQPLIGAPSWISEVLQYLSSATFIVVAACYLIKCMTAPQAVRGEFNHPIIGNLFGTLLISLLLQPIVIVQWSPLLARAMWVVGAVGMTAFAWLVVTRWLTHRQKIEHATPAWIVPVVGMLDVPLALPSLGLPPMHGVMVLSLAVGLFFAVPLFTMIMMRLVFEEPLPNALAPTLLILVAPFSVGVSTYLITVGQIDVFAQSLYALDVFVLATLFGRLRYLMGCCPFRVSWWAAGFPMGTSAIAGLRIAAANPGSVNEALAILLLALASALIVFLLVRTLVGVFDGELRHLSS
jgi:tellurite resistance protein